MRWRRNAPSPTKIQRRIASLPNHEIIGWAEQGLYEIGRGLRGGPLQLEAAEQGAQVLLAATQELRRRQEP